MEINNIAIIYQDHHLLVVNKPAGLVIHPTYKHASGTMWDALLDYLAQEGGDDWQPPLLPDEPEWARAPVHIQTMLREKRIQPAPMGRAFRIQKRKAHVTVHVSDEVKPVNQRSEGKGAKSAPKRSRTRK